MTKRKVKLVKIRSHRRAATTKRLNNRSQAICAQLQTRVVHEPTNEEIDLRIAERYGLWAIRWWEG